MPPPPKARRGVAPLENGDRLSAARYVRRHEAMPELKG
jgi:hypothetical protein